jgi:hypothetical protein
MTGKNRQCMAQIPDTPIPNRSHNTEAVILLLAKSIILMVDFVSVY